MTFAIAIDVLVVAWVLYRQVKVRRVWPRLTLRLPVVLAVIGIVELLTYTASRHVSGTVAGILTLSFVVGAIGLGALRAATVRIWRTEGAVLRQGTWLTIVLWLVSLGLHYGAEGWIDALHGPGGIVSASLLLWLGVTYGVQNAVVHWRAERLQEPDDPVDARSAVLSGRWWTGAWGGRGPGGPNGPGGGPGGPPWWTGGGRLPDSHAGAIDARAEPVSPTPEHGEDGGSPHDPTARPGPAVPPQGGPPPPGGPHAPGTP